MFLIHLGDLAFDLNYNEETDNLLWDWHTGLASAVKDYLNMTVVDYICESTLIS